MSNRLDLYKSALKDPRVKALLDTISYAEGTSGPEGYRTMFTGKKFDTSQGWRHPDTVMRGGGYASSAAGRYQMLTPTYQMAAKATGTSGFSPSEQDLQAVFLIDNRRALEPLLKGENINTVINQLAPEWASLPTSEGKSAYDQPVRGISELEKYYQSRLDGSDFSNTVNPEMSGMSSSSDAQKAAPVNVLALKDGVQGVLDKTSGEFTARDFTDEEAKRYERYGGTIPSAKGFAKDFAKNLSSK